MFNLNKNYIEEIKKQLNEDGLEKYLSSLNTDQNLGIVINNKKIDDDKTCLIIDDLKNEIDLNEYIKNKYYKYKKDSDISIGKTVYHHSGLLYSQEPSSYEVINNLDISYKFNFIDLCASPGGKSIDLLLKQKEGFCVLNEIDYKRTKILKSNIERMGFINTIITNNKPEDFLNNFSSFFDVVIVDAPCSGEGMFKKSETAVNNWSIDYVEYISKIQKDIIDVATKLLKKGGYLIYSTCTFSTKEDEENVEYILNNNKNLKLVKKDKLFPHLFEGEGQFYAIFKNEDLYIKEDEEHEKKLAYDSKVSNEVKNIINTYFDELNDIDFLYNYIIKTKKNKNVEEIYLINNELNDLVKDINTIYEGVLLGENTKDGFIPSNELAHSIIGSKYKYCINIDKDNSYKYLKGEVIDINDEIINMNEGFDFDKKNYVVLKYMDAGIGIGRVVNGKIKNFYPKGLRNF